MTSKINVTREEWLNIVAENKKLIAVNVITIAVGIIMFIGVVIAANMPELYLQSTWDSASSLMKFKLILVRVPLALNGAVLAICGMGAVYNIYIRTKYIYSAEEIVNEPTQLDTKNL